jgi:CRP-like cAMP-binding protein
MSLRLHGLVRDVEAYALDSGVQRIIGYLLRDQSDGETAPGAPLVVTLPVSKATVASRLSITPEYFSRVLHELEDAGLVKVDKREIHIPDAARLARYPNA